MIMSFHDRCVSDALWIVAALGEPITLHPTEDESVTVMGIIDRAVENAPAYGYENMLSGKCHAISIVTAAINFVPSRGMTVDFDGKTHKILNVSPITDTINLSVEY